MAFNSSNLILGRSSFLSLNKVVNNNYFSSDSLSTILASDYFPPYFGFDDNSVTVNDCLKIVSTSDNVVKEYLITSVNPLVLSSVSAVGSNQYISAGTSGAVVTDFPLYFYQNILGSCFLAIPGPFSFTVTSNGIIEFPGLVLEPAFFPPGTIYFNMLATYLSQPFNLNFVLNNQSPYLQLSNTFTMGQTISINNAYINY
jgi:hypothetical protein